MEWKYISKVKIHFQVRIVVDPYKQFDIYHAYEFFLKQISSYKTRNEIEKKKAKKYFITSNIKCRKVRDKHFGRKRNRSSKYFGVPLKRIKINLINLNMYQQLKVIKANERKRSMVTFVL